MPGARRIGAPGGTEPHHRRPLTVRVLRGAASMVCLSALAATGLLLIGRQVGAGSELGVSAVAILPLAVVAALAAEVLLIALRNRRSAAVGAVVVLVGVALQAPAYIPSGPQPATDLIVMTGNLRLGSADPASVVQTARTNGVDVLALQELTDQAVKGLSDAGLDTVFPYRVISPRAAGAGTGLWSRRPLTDGAVLPGFGFPPVRARLTVDGRSLTVLSFHSKAPVYNGGTGSWESDLRTLAAFVVDTSGPLVVAGDFNATFDHRQFRNLLGGGVTDVARATGAGPLRTYPADRTFGPLIEIDHVVVGGGVVGTGARAVPLDGSDHRGIVAGIAVSSSGD